jgi:hypothetical protein
MNKIFYILMSEIILFAFIYISLFFITIPAMLNLDSFDTAYSQYIFVLFLILLCDLLTCLTFFKPVYPIFFIHIISILLFGFTGIIIGYNENLFTSIEDLYLILFLPKFGLILLANYGPSVYFALYILLNAILKIFIITNKIKNKKERIF